MSSRTRCKITFFPVHIYCPIGTYSLVFISFGTNHSLLHFLCFFALSFAFFLHFLFLFLFIIRFPLVLLCLFPRMLFGDPRIVFIVIPSFPCNSVQFRGRTIPPSAQCVVLGAIVVEACCFCCCQNIPLYFRHWFCARR